VAARKFASRVVVDAGHGAAVADVALAVGELAANAYEHAGTPYDVTVRLDGCIRIEVSDASPELPVRGYPDDYAERGRGIALVEMVGQAWGVDRTPDGKTVWVEIAL
jgi:anti-sigma regulatory factor (Ser/Thr protein kinase)